MSLGFVPNWDKSELAPSQRFSFLGARFCLEEGLIGPSLDRLTRLATLIQRMLSARSASGRQIHLFLLGQMESMAHLCQMAEPTSVRFSGASRTVGLKPTSLGIFTFP